VVARQQVHQDGWVCPECRCLAAVRTPLRTNSTDHFSARRVERRIGVESEGAAGADPRPGTARLLRPVSRRRRRVPSLLCPSPTRRPADPALQGLPRQTRSPNVLGTLRSPSAATGRSSTDSGAEMAGRSVWPSPASVRRSARRRALARLRGRALPDLKRRTAHRPAAAGRRSPGRTLDSRYARAGPPAR
jgi:hypothetical protein